MQNKQTQHVVSDHLKDRYPYNQSDFSSETNINEVSSAYGARLIPKYIQLLDNINLTEKELIEALNNIQNLLSSQENKIVAIDYDIVNSIITHLNSSNNKIQEYSANIMASIFLDIQGRRHTNMEKVISSLNGLLFEKNDITLLAVTFALQNLSMFHDGIDIFIEKNYVMDQLIDMIEEKTQNNCSKNVLLNIFIILSNITKSAEATAYCVNRNLIHSVLIFLKNPIRHQPELLFYGISIIKNILLQQADTEICIKKGAIEIILHLLDGIIDGLFCIKEKEIKDKIIVLGTTFLMISSTNDLAKKIIVINGIKFLNYCLFLNDNYLIENTKKAILNSCEAPNGYYNFIYPLISHPEIVINVFQEKSLSTMNEILFKYLKDIKNNQNDLQMKQCLYIIERLTTNNKKGISEIIQCLNMIDNIISLIQQNSQTDIEIRIKKILKNIYESSSFSQKRVIAALNNHNLDTNEYFDS